MDGNQNQRPSSQQRVRGLARRAARLYKGSALILLNVLVLYLLLNGLLAVSFRVYDAWKERSDPHAGLDPVTINYGPEVLDRVYPGWDRRQRAEMLAENWNRRFVHEDYTHFRERPFAGKYVHVSEAGYRHSKDQGPWPPAAENLNIFCFGGSTMFGYGLPDDQTIASCLQESLAARAKRRVCIYNFGVGWYHSTQERIRFEKLLLSGFVPDIVFFIDGLNDANRPDNKLPMSGELARVFEQLQAFGESQSPNQGEARYSFKRLAVEVCFYRLPVGRAFRTIVRRMASPDLRMDRAQLENACNVYLTNKFLISQLCHRYDVTPVFVWQPVPGYKYDLKHHLFEYHPDLKSSQKTFYPMMRRMVDNLPHEPNFLWCADIQQDRAEPLYLDVHHYTAAFSKDFAASIVQGCLERHLFDDLLGPARPADSARALSAR